MWATQVEADQSKFTKEISDGLATNQQLIITRVATTSQHVQCIQKQQRYQIYLTFSLSDTPHPVQSALYKTLLNLSIHALASWDSPLVLCPVDFQWTNCTINHSTKHS